MTNISLASLPREEALRIARAAGATIGQDNEAMSEAFRDLRFNWIGRVCPGQDTLSEEEFDELVGQACDAFQEGFNEAYPAEVVPPDAGDFKFGSNVALEMLRSWQDRSEEGVTPAQMMAELMIAYHRRTGDERRGFGDTFMAWIMVVLEGSVPDVDGSWDVEYELANWGSDHD